MSKKICLITGANSGIGKITARELAKKGFHIVMLCRNREKAEKTRKEIINETGKPVIEIMLADLASLAEVREAATHFNRNYPKLDVLINNAGLVMGKERKASKDGFEMTFAVNHLSHFLLTALLFDKIQESDAGRIVTVSSEAHRYCDLDFNDLQMSQSYNAWKAYGNSKLFNILFTRELARRLAGTNITANCLHPGVIASNFATDASGAMNFFFRLARPLFKTPEQGAATSIFLAASADAQKFNGEYFKNKQVKQPSKLATSKHNAKRLWEISEELTQKSFLASTAKI